MGKRKSQSLPLEADQLKLQIQSWRLAKKSANARMPGELWERAIRLATSHGVSRIAHATGLDYGWLRKKVLEAKAKSSSATPIFLELPRAMAVPRPAESKLEVEAGCHLGSGSVIDLSTPDGTRMRIQLEAGQGLDAAGIVAAFLGRAR